MTTTHRCRACFRAVDERELRRHRCVECVQFNRPYRDEVYQRAVELKRQGVPTAEAYRRAQEEARTAPLASSKPQHERCVRVLP